MSAERLRAHMSADPLQGPGPDCPSDDRIFDGASGALPPHELGALVDHVSTCAWCSASWSVALEARAPAEVVDLSTARRRRVLGLTAGAGALVALAAAALFALSPADPDPTYRAQPADTVSSALPERASLPRQDFELRWSAPPGEWTFALSISNDALDVVYEVDGLSQPHHRVPAEALGGLPSGAPLVWTVRAHQGPGTESLSGSFVVTVE